MTHKYYTVRIVGTDIVKHGKFQKESSGINVVKRPAMVGRLLDYAYPGRLCQIVDMALNGSGVRDTAGFT